MSPDPKSPESLAAWSTLFEPGAEALLARAMAIEDPAHPGPKDLPSLRALAEPALVAAAIELVQARRKGARKFACAERMILDLPGVEQASGADVAAWKARRFVGLGGPTWDLCCGIGGDAMALAGIVEELIAVDMDPLACRMAEHNLGLVEPGSHRSVRQQSVESLMSEERLTDAWLHIDPARRVGGSHSGRGGRSWYLEDCRPGPDVLEALLRVSRGAAIKLGPGVDLEEIPQAETSEIEVLGSRGGLKQVLLWSGELAGAPGRRRASQVEKGQSYAATPLSMPRHRAEISSYLYIPDPALERADLVGARLAERGVEAWNLHPGLGYLHGPGELRDPWFACYRIEAVLPWRERKLKAWLKEHGGGPIEVRTRAGAVVVEKALRELRGDGEQRYVLFGLRLGKRILAFVTRPLDPAEPTSG